MKAAVLAAWQALHASALQTTWQALHVANPDPVSQGTTRLLHHQLRPNFINFAAQTAPVEGQLRTLCAKAHDNDHLIAYAATHLSCV
jgi:hypothetical protein